MNAHESCFKLVLCKRALMITYLFIHISLNTELRTSKRMNADSGAKSKFNMKLLAILVIVIVIIAVVAVVVSWQIYWRSSSSTKSKSALPALKLTLIGANGQQKILNSGELATLKSYTATGRITMTITRIANSFMLNLPFAPESAFIRLFILHSVLSEICIKICNHQARLHKKPI